MVYKLNTPEVLETFLLFFSNLFTVPSYRYFCSFIIGLMVLKTKRCGTNINLKQQYR